MSKLLDSLRKKHAGDQAAAKRHSITFLFHRDEVAEALREGWTAKQIWEQMSEDGTATMSYVHFCRLVKKHITSAMNDAHGEAPSATASSPRLLQPEKPTQPPVKTPNTPEKPLTEKERLDLLKEEAFKSVRSSKPDGPLISKPKTREEENRELFGE